MSWGWGGKARGRVVVWCADGRERCYVRQSQSGAEVSDPRRARMTADEFIEWAMGQPETEHYELAGGEIVAMAPERLSRARAKLHITMRLAAAIETRGLNCEAIVDGRRWLSTTRQFTSPTHSSGVDRRWTATSRGSPIRLSWWKCCRAQPRAGTRVRSWWIISAFRRCDTT
jgi:hypothetical protein